MSVGFVIVRFSCNILRSHESCARCKSIYHTMHNGYLRLNDVGAVKRSYCSHRGPLQKVGIQREVNVVPEHFLSKKIIWGPNIEDTLLGEGPLLHDRKSSSLVDIRSGSGRVTSEELSLRIRELVDLKVKLQSKSTNLELGATSATAQIDSKDLGSSRNPTTFEQPVEENNKIPPELTAIKLANYYASLSKARLTILVVVTSLAGYIMAPAPFSMTALALVSLGTGLTSAAANTINQVMEVQYDGLMNRTKHRVLVRGLLSVAHAKYFAAICAVSGLSILYFGVNGTAACLGALTLCLYTMVYTPMKRISIANTWIGSVVGAIPPLIGWAGCTGGLEAGAWIMAGILFAWQFPHFNALSWNLQPDYKRAGYHMMSVYDQDLCRRTALRYSLLMFAFPLLSWQLGVTTWSFTVDSVPLNFYLSFLAYKFYQDADSSSSRRLFRFSLLHLPAFMLLMILGRKRYRELKNDLEVSDVATHLTQKV